VNSDVIEKWDMGLSRQRLDVKGFHSAVTSMSPQEIIDKWNITFAHLDPRKKPPRDVWIDAVVGKARMKSAQELLDHWETIKNVFHERNIEPTDAHFKALFARYRVLTSSPLIFRSDAELETFKQVPRNRARTDGSRLSVMLQIPYIGEHIAEAVFANGLDSAQKLAATSRHAWHALTTSVKIWDFVLGRFHNKAHSGVFFITAPVYTVDEFLQTQEMPAVEYIWSQDKAKSQFVALAGEIMKLERSLYEAIAALRIREGPIHPYWVVQTDDNARSDSLRELLAPQIINAIRSLRDTENLGEANQFHPLNRSRTFELQMELIAIVLPRMGESPSRCVSRDLL
jgi:hypothetical protein